MLGELGILMWLEMKEAHPLMGCASYLGQFLDG